jgi:hypothetical protein
MATKKKKSAGKQMEFPLADHAAISKGEIRGRSGTFYFSAFFVAGISSKQAN